MMRSRYQGAVALEFLLLFPLVVSLIYAAGVYGVMFSWQVRMQVAVDRASAAVMHLDRSQTNTPMSDAIVLANNALSRMELPSGAVSECRPVSSAVECSLRVNLADEGPGQLGFFGGFPPLPDNLIASARVTF